LVARLAATFSSVWVATALTGVTFVVLYRFGLLGDLPLGVLVGLLGLAALGSEVGGRWGGSDPTPAKLTALVGLHVLTTTIIIYSIGWGPTLAIGYLFVAARDLEGFGARASKPTLLWTVVGTLVGQVAIAVGLVHSYVSQPAVHGLAVLACLGVAFVVHLLGSKTDQRERDLAALAAGEASFRQLFADNPQPMWVFDAETLAFLEVNEAAVGHYGYTRDEFLARAITDIRPAEDLPRLVQEVQSQRRGVRHGDWRHRLSDGRIIDVEVSSHGLSFGGRPAVLVAIQDMTERTALEAELRHQAFHDALTNLANRALFIDRADHAVRRLERGGTNVAVLVLDLDGFKMVNDSLGHSAGDTLLVAVAGRLQTALRSGDTAARLGGDEFAVLVEDAKDPEEAALVADRLLEALAAPFGLAGKEVFVRASVGVALTSGDRDAEDLLRDADAAMYQAKADGKSCHRLFEPAMYSASLARLELEGDLRRAVELGEFVLHYQPVVEAATSRVVALEALVRWQHPTRGLVTPDEFIPLAEDNGLIVDIGRWVLREACQQTRVWQAIAGNEDLTIAVNLSARQLTDPDLVRDVARALADAGLPPASLTLEITETVLMRDPEVAIGRLRELKCFGVRLAIDDFGTGYSSLSSLQRLPVDILKIDKAFVDEVTCGVEAAGLVEAVVRLAGTLALETVAEGVERPEQLERLQVLGCQQIQGFYFSRPLTPADVEQYLYQHPTNGTNRPLHRPEAEVTAFRTR
jgi:diguanylate cyclase (GGDEF)-like protein/PAS domain S-box-containing protein